MRAKDHLCKGLEYQILIDWSSLYLLEMTWVEVKNAVCACLASADEGDSASGESIHENRGRFALETQKRSGRHDLGVSGVKAVIFIE